MRPMRTVSGRRATIRASMGAVCLALAFAVTACGGPSSRSTQPERTLAQLDGDPSTEAQFGAILDTFQSGGTKCKPDPDRQHAADLITAAYQKAGARGSLLDFATLLVSACG
jgi:hypothetical protein